MSATWIIPPMPGMIEPSPAPVIWIDTIGAISLKDGVVTTYYVAEKQSLFGREIERPVEVILKRPCHRIFEGMGQFARIAEFMFGPRAAQTDTPPPCGFRPHLVRGNH